MNTSIETDGLVGGAYAWLKKTYKSLNRMTSKQVVPVIVAGVATLVSAAPAPVQAADRLAAIKQAGIVRVCIWPDYYSITYRDKNNGQLIGLDIEMARELGRELGVTVQFVDSSFAKLIENLTTHQCDVAMHGVSNTPARAQQLNFSRPYMRSDIYLMTTRSNRVIKSWDDMDKPGAVIGVAAGTVAEPLLKERLKNAQVVAIRAPMTREQELEAGRIDAFTTDWAYSRRMLDHANWVKMIMPPKPFYQSDYAYATAKDDPIWSQRVDQFVASIQRDGRLLESAKRYRLDPVILTRAQ